MNENYYIDTSYGLSRTKGLTGAIMGMGLPMIIIIILINILMIISLWKIYKKAGKPGWVSIVPIYNFIVMCEIADKKWWYIFFMLLPIINIYIIIVLCNGLAKKFKKSDGFVVGMILLPIIFFPILAFEKSDVLPTTLNDNELNNLNNVTSLSNEINQNNNVNSVINEQYEKTYESSIKNNPIINTFATPNSLNNTDYISVNSNINEQITNPITSQNNFAEINSDAIKANNNTLQEHTTLIENQNESEISNFNTLNITPNKNKEDVIFSFKDSNLIDKNEAQSFSNIIDKKIIPEENINYNIPSSDEEILDIDDLSSNDNNDLKKDVHTSIWSNNN